MANNIFCRLLVLSIIINQQLIYKFGCTLTMNSNNNSIVKYHKPKDENIQQNYRWCNKNNKKIQIRTPDNLNLP